ncbi:MAG: methyltransferase [Clostridia bacterium]|nr:methyltransferase [Clostridia bacterium]
MLKPNERLDDLQFNNLFIIQNPNLYCFTSDAVELCNFIKCGAKDRIVDLCSGSGVIGILAQAKTKAKQVYLVELQEELASMSKRSVNYNKLTNVEVINAPLQNIHKQIGDGFEVVVCNPPYKINNGGEISEKREIAICKHEITVTLEEIVCEASKLLKFGGKFYTVNKEERLTDLFCLMRKYGIEPKVLKIRKSTKGANIILVEGKKGAKSGLKIQV